MKRVLAILLFCTLAVSAQQVGQNTQTGGGPKISVTTNLVVEAVSVKDKKGNPIKGLTTKDFTITEDGVAQQIKFFDAIELPDTPATAVTVPAEPRHHRL